MEKETKHLIDLFKQKRYSVISDRMMEVDNHKVCKMRKLTCDCEHQPHTKQEGLCRHKKFFIAYPILKLYSKNIKDLIEVCNAVRLTSKDKHSVDLIKGEIKNKEF